MAHKSKNTWWNICNVKNLMKYSKTIMIKDAYYICIKKDRKNILFKKTLFYEQIILYKQQHKLMANLMNSEWI